MRGRGILLAGTALGLLCAGQAAAQTASAKNAVIVEELVVTAKQHIDNLQDAPVAVTTFTAEQRNLVGANTINDMVALTPGTTISDNGINIRGVGRQTSESATLGSDSPVAYYVNGFYSVVAGVVGESTLYSESVQFLRGPQGTQFGRNAIGGTVSLLARHPTKEMQGEAVAQYGSSSSESTGFWGVGANVAGPLNDRWGIRLGAQHFDADKSYQHNVGGTPAGLLGRSTYLEFQLEGHVTDALHVWLRSTTFSYNSDPFYSHPPVYGVLPTPGVPGSGTPAMGSLAVNPYFGLNVPVPSGPFDINVDTRGVDRLRDNQVHIFNADYDFGGAKLSYVGGYAQYQSSGFSDFDRTSRAGYTVCAPSVTVTCAPGTAPFPGLADGRFVSTYQVQDYTNRNHYFTHELRLEGNDKSRLDWVVGLFYLNSFYNEFYEQTEPNEPAFANPTIGFNPATPAAPNPSRAFYQQQNIRKTDSRAAFGDVTFHLNQDWEVSAGLRYTVEKAFGTTHIRYIFYNPAFGVAADVSPGMPFGLAGFTGATLNLRNPATTGRFAVTYHPSQDTLIYAQASRGFLAGAFNMGNVIVTANQIAQPEYLNDFEVGWKQQFGRTFRADATAFYYDYENLQVPGSIVANGIVTSNVIFNIDKARSYGAELQGTWTPERSIWLNANYTYLNAKIVHDCCEVDANNPATRNPDPVTGLPRGVALDGSTLPRSPEHKVAVSGAYTWTFAPGSLILGGSAAYQSSTYQFVFNNPAYLLPGRTLVNASLTFRTADNHYDLSVQASNLLDKRYFTNVEVGSNGAGGVALTKIYGGPRFVQAILRYRW